MATMETTGSGKTRNPMIDRLKGAGMLLVIVGHLNSEPYVGYSVIAHIYAFHMSLFFVISGYLLSGGADRLSFFAFARKRAWQLLIPYAAFFVFSILFSNTVHSLAVREPLFSSPVNAFELLRGFVFAGATLEAAPVLNVSLWFPHALFFVSLTFYACVRIRSLPLLVFVALVFSALTLPWQRLFATSPIWLLRLYPAALFYMLCGHMVKSASAYPVPDRLKALCTPLTGGMLLMAGLWLIRFGRGDIWDMSAYWYFPTSLLSIAGLFLLLRQNRSDALAYVGRNSLYYLALHSPAMELPIIKGIPELCAGLGYDGLAVFIFYSLAALMLTTAMVAAVKWFVRIAFASFSFWQCFPGLPAGRMQSATRLRPTRNHPR